MPLHPQVDAFLRQIVAAGVKGFHQMPVDECRREYRARSAGLPKCARRLAAVRDQAIPGPAGPLRTRLYTPEGPGPFPVLVFFHGGGWVVGDLDTHDNVCREVCGGAGIVVLAVDYRLGPEHRFPAAPDDCIAAVRWVFDNVRNLDGDPARIAVGGDSAGGNLSALVAQRLRDTGGPRLAAQVLIYPATRLDVPDTRSMIDNAKGYRLERADIDWFLGHYLASPADGRNPAASPLLAADFANLPPALVITCEFDPLRDEGEDYGRAMQAAGVPVTISRYDGTIHGSFTLYALLEPGRRMMDAVVRWLKETLRN